MNYKTKTYRITGVMLIIIFGVWLAILGFMLNSGNAVEAAATTATTETRYAQKWSVVQHKPDYTYLTASTTAESGYNLTDEEKRMISITAVNADFSSDESFLCVIRVIRNRLECPEKFKQTTIEGVLKAPKQFENCERVAGYAQSSYDFEHIITLIDKVFIEDYNPFDCDNVFFYANKKVKKDRIAKNLILVKTAGSSNFYKQE